jgi:dienelactone hydrolase
MAGNMVTDAGRAGFSADRLRWITNPMHASVHCLRRLLLRLPVALILMAAVWAATGPEFGYDRSVPIQLRDTSPPALRGVASVRDVSFKSAGKGRTGAYLVSPRAPGKHAAILYVHWYEPESPDSDRTQFLEEAVALAGRGAVSLLVETMWSDRTWFTKRTRDGDFARSVNQVKELRRALDVLLAQPGVDLRRVAYIGHDFGAMYGILTGAADRRPAAYVLMAPTEKFSDWFLLGPPKLEGDALGQFVQELAPLDPINHVGRLAPAAVLFQFGKVDRYVPVMKAERLFAAAGEPKAIFWYEGGHGLSSQAKFDRVAWLARQLKLGPASPQ